MDIKELILKRRTIRKFKQTPIPQQQLLSYIDAARLAPSAANIQPLKYVAVNGKEMTDKLFPLLKWAGYLNGTYTPKKDEKPVAYIVICADTSLRKSGYWEDAGAAAENIILSALCDDVGSCWLGSVDRTSVKKLLELDENIEIISVIALGHPAESPKDVSVKDNDIKYFLEDSTLCVPKRSAKDVIIKTFE